MLPAFQDNNWGLLTLREWFQFIPYESSSILEVGCGNGKTCRLLTDMRHDVTGIDIVPGPYDRDGYEFIQHDIAEMGLPFVDDTFEMAISFDVLEHIEPDKVLFAISEMSRVAKTVAFVVPLLDRTMDIALQEGKCHRTVRDCDWWIDTAARYLFTVLATEFEVPTHDMTRLMFYGESKKEEKEN